MKLYQTVLSSLLLFALPQIIYPDTSATPDLTGEPKKEELLGNILKQTLENYHFRKIKIDNSVSEKAFNEFLKKLDYGKQFLTSEDVKKLQLFRLKMDDDMTSGKHELLKQVVALFIERVKQAESYRESIFKNKFDFTKKESFELDPDKRQWAKNEAQLKERWRMTFKYYTLNNYLTLIESDNSSDKDNKGKKTKADEKLSPEKALAQAHDAISKKYAEFFKRLLRDERIDYLEKFYNSVATIFDPHTTYLPPNKKEDFDIDISGQLEGIGAVLQEDGPHIKVVNIVPGGAAWRQKELTVDDIILAVAEGSKTPVSIVNMGVDDAVRYIRGKKNTEVRLTVKKADGTRKIISIIRDVVQIGATYAKSSIIQYKNHDVKLGYIYLPKFYRDFDGGPNCTEDVRSELKRLKKENVDGVILDLRNNGGGALEDAKLISGLFIKEGPIVQVKNHTQQVEVLSDTDQGIEYDGPLIVMVNMFSASASEILAGAMSDYKRAIIVGGQYTHGKGTVQVVLNLNQGPFLSFINDPLGALKVTIQKFYRITGLSTQYAGITPHIVLPDPLGHLESREKDLEYSLKWDKIAPRKYNTWDKFTFDLRPLQENSAKRVKANKHMQKIIESVNYLKKRKNDTNVSLNLKETIREDEENKKITEKYTIDFVDKNISVSNYEASLKAHEKIRKEDEEKWKEDFKRRKEEWVENIQKDILLAETMFIARDHIHQLKRQRLGKK